MREEVWFDQVHAYFYRAQGKAAYSLLIVHGIGGNGSTYDVFCEPLAARGVNVYSMDLAGHGKTANPKGNFRQEEWLADMDHAAKAIRARHPGNVVFVLGSSQGAGPAFHSLAVSDAISGAILMGMAPIKEAPPHEGTIAGDLYAEFHTPGSEEKARRVGDDERFDLVTLLDWNRNYAKDDPDILAKKMQDPLRAWSYGYASMRSIYAYEPPIPASANTKPLLVTSGEDDPLTPSHWVREAFGHIGGPTELMIVPKGTHQLMLYHTDEYVPLVDGWVRRHLPLNGMNLPDPVCTEEKERTGVTPGPTGD